MMRFSNNLFHLSWELDKDNNNCHWVILKILTLIAMQSWITDLNIKLLQIFWDFTFNKKPQLKKVNNFPLLLGF